MAPLIRTWVLTRFWGVGSGLSCPLSLRALLLGAMVGGAAVVQL